MDDENLKDFTKTLRSFLREMECYDSDTFAEAGGYSAYNAVDQLEKAIMRLRTERYLLEHACKELLVIIDEHGNSIIKAHATKIAVARNTLSFIHTPIENIWTKNEDCQES